MLSKTMEKALNEQINAEFYSSYMYLSMSTYFDSIGLPGAATWIQAQTQEEWFHGMKLLRYVNERGGRVALKAIKQPPVEWKSTLHVFQEVLAHRPVFTLQQGLRFLINGGGQGGARGQIGPLFQAMLHGK